MSLTEKIAILMDELAPEEEFNQTELHGVRLHKASYVMDRVPLCYNQGIIIVGQGTKNVYVGGNKYTYNPDNYLVLSVPLPAECEGIGSPTEPLIGLMIDIDLGMLNSTISQMESSNSAFSQAQNRMQKGIFVSKSSEEFKDATYRLLKSLQCPEQARIMGPGILQEILYRIMCSENAASLYSLAMKNSNLARIERALKQIHNHFNQPMDVNELASLVNMSPTSFHRAFKEVTSTSPIQYIKRIRLDKAKGLLQLQGYRVNEAALAVGYESSTQFSREFKRIFGVSPVNVAA